MENYHFSWVNQHKSTINGPCSIADCYQRLYKWGALFCLSHSSAPLVAACRSSKSLEEQILTSAISIASTQTPQPSTWALESWSLPAPFGNVHTHLAHAHDLPEPAKNMEKYENWCCLPKKQKGNSWHNSPAQLDLLHHLLLHSISEAFPLGQHLGRSK